MSEIAFTVSIVGTVYAVDIDGALLALSRHFADPMNDDSQSVMCNIDIKPAETNGSEG